MESLTLTCWNLVEKCEHDVTDFSIQSVFLRCKPTLTCQVRAPPGHFTVSGSPYLDLTYQQAKTALPLFILPASENSGSEFLKRVS